MKFEAVPTEVLEEILEKQKEINEKLDELKTNNPSFKWVDIPEACTLLKVSPRTLQNYRDGNYLGFSQIGSKIYFKIEDLENFLERHYINAKKK